MSYRALSIIELFKNLVESEMAGDLPGGVFVGPANNTAQQSGCVQLMSAGLGRKEAYLPLQWQRIQIRCVAGTMLAAESIAGLFMLRIDNRNRITLSQASNGHDYLVHVISIEAGPSMHFDTPATWEVLLFAEMCVGTRPVDDPADLDGGGGYGEGGFGTP